LTALGAWASRGLQESRMNYEKAIERYERIYKRVELADLLSVWDANAGDLNVYVHSPFCPSICKFCYYKGVEFSFESDAALYDRYYSSYLPGSVAPFRELLQSRSIGNYFFGGGTPSLMRPDTMRTVFDLFPNFAAVGSKTFELHPAVWSREQVDILAERNFNCCIIGIQSFDRAVLDRQNRRYASFEAVLQLANYIKSKGMYLAADLIYRMDGIDADEIFKRDLELVGELGSDVISLQLNYDLISEEDYTERFFELILSSALGREYCWEGADSQQISLNLKKRLKCFRYVHNDVPLQTYRKDIFPFVRSLDEASKVIGHGSNSPSVIGFGSYQNPRKNTFSIVRDGGSAVEYIEINNNWAHQYYITFESRSRDFFDDCIKELDLIRELGAPPMGMKIVLENKVPATKEDSIFRRVDSQVTMSVSWDYMNPRIAGYVDQLKQVFPHWKWWTDD
jgi:hypothetical protein